MLLLSLLLLLLNYFVSNNAMNSYLVTTIVGTGTGGYTGDGQASTSAQLNYPFGLCADSAGNLYIGDSQSG